MENIKLSPLADKLFDGLNSIGHICSIEQAALVLSDDQTISDKKRRAYMEIYAHAVNDY